MNEQESVQTFLPARPATDDPGAWRAYWQQLGQHWRTEPEIDAERQQYLAERRAIVPDIEKGVYPFTGIKLSRADIEWLFEQAEVHGPATLAQARAVLEACRSPQEMQETVLAAVARNEEWRGKQCLNLLAPEAPTSPTVRALLSSEVRTANSTRERLHRELVWATTTPAGQP